MNARRLGKLAAFVTLAASGAYVFIYLYRWEWNRAQMSAAIFIAAEVGLIGWLLADRMRRLERRLDHAALDAEQRRAADPADDRAGAAYRASSGSCVRSTRTCSSRCSSAPVRCCRAWRGSSSGSPRRRPGAPPSTGWPASSASSICRVAACSTAGSIRSHCSGGRGDETAHRLPRPRRRRRRRARSC